MPDEVRVEQQERVNTHPQGERQARSIAEQFTVAQRRDAQRIISTKDQFSHIVQNAPPGVDLKHEQAAIAALVNQYDTLATTTRQGLTGELEHVDAVKTEKGEEEKKLEIAQKSGVFYGKMIDLCLTHEHTDQRSIKVTEALSELPEEVRSQYVHGVEVFQEELAKNSEKMREGLIPPGESLPPDEEMIKRRILRYSLENKGYDRDVQSNFFRAVRGKVTLDEPIEGLPILRIDPDVADTFRAHGLLAEGSEAVCSRGVDKNPTYIIVVKEDPTSSDQENTRRQAHVRHEVHHFIWTMLRYGEFVKPAQEQGALAAPFVNLRDELGGYLISGEAVKGDTNRNMLVDTDNQEVYEAVDEVNDLLYVSLQLAQKQNIDPSSYLYPVLTAQTFDEIKSNIIGITPLEKPISSDTLYDLFKWSKFHRNLSGKPTAQLLEGKGIGPEEIAPSSVDAFFTRAVEEGEVHNGYREIKNILKFFQDSGIKFPQHPWIQENLFLLDE